MAAAGAGAEPLAGRAGESGCRTYVRISSSSGSEASSLSFACSITRCHDATDLVSCSTCWPPTFSAEGKSETPSRKLASWAYGSSRISGAQISFPREPDVRVEDACVSWLSVLPAAPSLTPASRASFSRLVVARCCKVLRKRAAAMALASARFGLSLAGCEGIGATSLEFSTEAAFLGFAGWLPSKAPSSPSAFGGGSRLADRRVGRGGGLEDDVHSGVEAEAAGAST